MLVCGLNYAPDDTFKCWCKVFCRREDVDLNESGAYAFAVEFTSAKEPIEIESDQFFLTAWQRNQMLGGYGGKYNGRSSASIPGPYEYSLVHCVKQPSKLIPNAAFPPKLVVVQMSEVRKTAWNVLRNSQLVPSHKRSKAMQNQAYMIAIYVANFYESLKAVVTLQPGSVPAHVKAAKRRRKIDMNILREQSEE